MSSPNELRTSKAVSAGLLAGLVAGIAMTVTMLVLAWLGIATPLAIIGDRLSVFIPPGPFLALMGKVGVSVSPANPDRVYAIVEADSGGLWRSDDAGKTWRLLSPDRLIRARAWYYTNVVADPKNADVVYVMNAPILKSIDGGRTFTVLPAKHGDNHQLWINPLDNNYMINANDGGAIVTTNGGRSWSTEDNQPTAQIYRVNTDAQFRRNRKSLSSSTAMAVIVPS